MVDRQPFPIPSELTPDTFCLCLQIPNNNDWKQVVNGLLAQMTYWFNWARDDAHSGKILAAYWTEIYLNIDWTTMSCCCDQQPAIYRYNSDGIYQRSTDGGVTWVDAPEYDYRNTSITFPPTSALGIDNTKCQAADSAVVILNEDVIQGLDNGAAVQALLEFVAAVLIFYLSAGTLATVAIGLFSMAAAIVGFGVSSTKAAFTSGVLNQLRCSIYNAMNSDDSIDTAGITTLLTDINDNYTGIIKTSLYSLISAAGAVGVTNMIRSNRGDAAADCSGCTPMACNTDNWTTTFGTEVSRDSGSITVTPAIAGGLYIAQIRSSGNDDCCVVNFSGVGRGAWAWWLCGDDPDTDPPQNNHSLPTTDSVNCVNVSDASNGSDIVFNMT